MKNYWCIIEKASRKVVTRSYPTLRECKEVFDNPVQSCDPDFYEIRKIS